MVVVKTYFMQLCALSSIILSITLFKQMEMQHHKMTYSRSQSYSSTKSGSENWAVLKSTLLTAGITSM